MAAPSKVQVLDVNILATAMATALTTSLGPFVDAIRQERDSRHNLRNNIQDNADKINQLDTEVRLLKGVQQQLMGDGTGTTGMLPSLQREGVKTQNDVSELKGDMKQVKDTLERMEANMEKLSSGQSKSNTFMDGWKGVLLALGIAGTCCTVIGGVVAAVIWLYGHGHVN